MTPTWLDEAHKRIHELPTKRTYGVTPYEAAVLADTARLLRACEVMWEALEFISCEGMDDGDVYAEDDPAAGAIRMMNRAREALAQVQALAAAAGREGEPK